MQSHRCKNQEHFEGERRFQRHLAEDAKWNLGAGQAIQGLRHEKVPAEHEQRAQEAGARQE